MAQTVILEKRVLSFVFYDSLGAWSSNSNPALFVPEIGVEYSVYWDGNSYSCFGFTSAAIPDNYLLGNPLPAGGADNGIPFLMSAISDGSGMSIMTFDQGDTHEVGIYKVEEDAEPPSADVKIKGYSGSYLNYEKVPKVWLAAPESTEDNPVLVPFTYGEALDNVEITPDFSAGDQKINLPEGYMARSIVVKKPENVITEPDSWIEFTLDENNEIISAAPHNFKDIPFGCFAYMTSLTTVDFTNSPGLTSIKGYAFRGCTALANITLPDSIESIGRYAFYECSSLSQMDIPNSVTSIGDYAFAYTKYDHISIPDSVTTLGANCFTSCKSLESVRISTRITELPSALFSNCSLLKNIEIPNSVVIINSSAFSACASIETITIPSSVTTLGNSAFSNCDSLKKVIINGTITNCGTSVFYSCDALTTFEGNITVIGGTMFNSCNSLVSLVLPDGLQEIGDNAFLACKGLQTITIPASVTKIGKNAFQNSTLATAIFKDTNGWYVSTTSNATSGTSVTVTNSTTAANYLRSTYTNYYWFDKT